MNYVACDSEDSSHEEGVEESSAVQVKDSML